MSEVTISLALLRLAASLAIASGITAAYTGNLVAPKNIRRKKSEGDEYLRETYGGDRGPKLNKPFDPSADEE